MKTQIPRDPIVDMNSNSVVNFTLELSEMEWYIDYSLL